MAMNPVESFEQHYVTPDPYGHAFWYSEKQRIRETLALLFQYGKLFERSLELACGEGDISNELMKLTAHLVAVDISENALSRARKLNEAWGNRITFIRGNAYEIEFERESFDFVSVMEALHYAQDREHQLNRVLSWLRPGGIILFSGANISPPYYTYDEIRRLFNRPDLEVLRWEPVNTKFPTQFLQNRGLLPKNQRIWEFGLWWARAMPRVFAKVIAVLARKKK
jgi:ubiquinone/menaquinone biosynthesis C-methylase UbiE